MADAMTRAPLLACADLRPAAAVKAYCESEEGAAQLRTTFSDTTRFGKLLDVRVAVRPRNRRPSRRPSRRPAAAYRRPTVSEPAAAHDSRCT